MREFRGKYNSAVEIRTQELIQDAKMIFEQYVSPNAPSEVNLPADATKDCIASFTDQARYCFVLVYVILGLFDVSVV